MNEAIKQPQAKSLIRRYLEETGRKGVSSLMRDIQKNWGAGIFQQRTFEKWLNDQGRFLQDENWKIVLSFIQSEHFKTIVPFDLRHIGDQSVPLSRPTSSGTLSETSFSDGLRQSLQGFNSELRYLTVEQIKALESSLQHQNLWISGSAGTGKTIFAIEAAYRALRAGHSVLIVFRSRQFFSIFSELLSKVSQNLCLLLHLDFMYLLRLLELHGLESTEFSQVASELIGMGATENQKKLFFFDLVIVDDCGTYESQMPNLLKQVEYIAYRKILLAAPEQILEHLSFEKTNDDSINRIDEICSVENQSLHVPDDYFEVVLNKNIRNSSKIVQYTSSKLGIKTKAGLLERGKVTVRQTNWQSLDKTILDICSKLLQSFPPDRMKILVDPFIFHTELNKLSSPDDNEAYDALMRRLPALTSAILRSARGVEFLHSTFECEEEDIQQLLSDCTNTQAYFIFTDGEEVGMVNDEVLDNNLNLDHFHEQYNQWTSAYIDAADILDEKALHDPLQTGNAILIYPVPLFIGLESDVVIYVHNNNDRLEDQLIDENGMGETLKKARNAHHFMAMSRAKYHLVDVICAE